MNLNEAKARHPSRVGRRMRQLMEKKNGGDAVEKRDIADWCAICVTERLKRHVLFDGAQGITRAVTTVSGTRVCGPHAEELLQRVLEKADLEAWSARS